MRRLGGGARGARSRAGESERGNAKRPADALDRPTAESEEDDRKRETDEEELQLHAEMLSQRAGASKGASSTSSVRVAVLELAALDLRAPHRLRPAAEAGRDLLDAEQISFDSLRVHTL